MGSPLRGFAVIVLALPFVLLLALVRREPSRGVPTEVRAAVAESDGAGAALGYVRREEPEAPALAPEQESARSFLARYHGDDWPSVEARLEKAGAKLDVPYFFHPWEEAEPVIRAGYRLSAEERAGMLETKLGWPTEATVEWVRSTFATGRPYPLGEEDLPLIQDLVADLNLELLGKAELYCDLLDVTLQERFRVGRYSRFPYTNSGLETETGFYATGVGALGWATGMVLTREAHPELSQLQDEMRALRHQRRERVVRYLHGKLTR